MIEWLKRRRLASLVEELAIYNDKGIAWSGHDPARAEVERSLLLAKVEQQIASIGEENVSRKLLEAIADGGIRLDSTGKYVPYAKHGKL
ncbi:hypothetical protein [Arsukibacterium sp.]|uniref:hypothetical protein n=1 Tax=Arsukibacterium sp. TaxID=1977258 RepID=UPI001BCD7214|nr:hypothetical protein [Arsukibacterium sp.]